MNEGSSLETWAEDAGQEISTKIMCVAPRALREGSVQTASKPLRKRKAIRHGATHTARTNMHATHKRMHHRRAHNTSAHKTLAIRNKKRGRPEERRRGGEEERRRGGDAPSAAHTTEDRE